jgi:hypothetical protein
VYAPFACHGFVAVIVLVFNSSVFHRPGGSRFPVNTTFPFSVMITSFAVNVAMHPASQKVPIESSACPFKPGNTWASNAFCGNFGNGKEAVCELVMKCPFGNLTLIGFVAVILLVHAVSNRM